MKDSFTNRVLENLKVAEIAFENNCYNASANRAYYAAFHAAIAALYVIGITPNIDHKTVQTLFSDNYFNRKKLLPSKFKGYLKELQNIRSDADYKNGVSKNISKHQLNDTKEFVKIILEMIK
jgi:uncharacterized protein (UPF0332 family)